MSSYSDSDIIEGILSEDDYRVGESLKLLYKATSQMITQIVYAHGGNKQDAEDLVQEVLLMFRAQVLAGKFVYREDIRISTYIYRIATNQWYTTLSKRNAESKRATEYYIRSDYAEKDPLRVVVDSEETSRFWAVFSKLSPLEQELLRQFYDQKMSLEQIAGKLEIKSADAAKMMKHRTMLKLRKLIKKYLGTI